MNEFVTYAQNFEDLMLWRALNTVESGFYIDVGAADPDEDSVTRAFYDRGWRGVNIEPSPDQFTAIALARPRDINLNCLAGDLPGKMNLYCVPDTGLSTVEQEAAERYRAEGRLTEVVRIPVRTLADICQEFAPQDIHFLKIDVEGAEAQVLRGADFMTYRPWIVLAEATRPNSQVENWETWDHHLIDASYKFVWFDGLNRFYLAVEREDALRHAFRTPPNVFDDWIHPRGRQQNAILSRAYATMKAMEQLQEEMAKIRAAADADSIFYRNESQAVRIEASNTRAEASALRIKEDVTRREADAAKAEVISLRISVTALQQAIDTAKANNANLGSSLLAAQQAAESAHTQLTRIDEFHKAARAQVEAVVTALRASRSWRVTAPLRAVSLAVRWPESDPARRSRLRQVAGIGQERPSPAKAAGRVAIYGIGRLAARTPGGHATAHLFNTIFPEPYKWLQNRYMIYRNAAAEAMASGSSPAPVSSPAPADCRLPTEPEPSGLASEERMMLRRLSARVDAT